RPNAREIEQDLRAVQPGRRGGDDEAVLATDVGPHLRQPGDMHVEPAGTDGVTARVCDPHPTPAGEQRPEHADGRAQPPYEVVVRLRAGLTRHVDHEVASV